MRGYFRKAPPIALILLAAISGRAALDEAANAYVEQAGHSRGLAVALIGPEGTETIFAGDTGHRDDPEIGPNTLFEIGSVTKVFSGILLAELVGEGVVSLDTTVGELIPGDRVPHAEIAGITLLELATHSSGLPRMPPAGIMLWRLISRPADPYAGSTAGEIFDTVAGLDGDRLEGRGQSRYSNLGLALLGRLLEAAAGERYEELLNRKVLAPMGLESTRFTRQWIDDPRMARPHRFNLHPTRHWRLDGYNPAGGLASSLSDMTGFLKAVMEAEPGSALDQSTRAAWQDSEGERRAGLGWTISEEDGERMIWHNGRTGGFYVFAGFIPERGRGVVVLSNTSHAGDPFAISMLRGDPEVPEPQLDWVWLIFTVLLVSLAPLMLFRMRGELVFSIEGRAKNPRGRIHMVNATLYGAVVLALSWKIGAWNVLPHLLWFGGFAAAAYFLAANWPLANKLPWLPPDRPLRAATAVTGLVVGLVLLHWVLYRV